MTEDTIKELAKKIKWAGDSNNGKDQRFYLGELAIHVYYNRKTRGVDEYNNIIVLKVNNKRIADFSYVYKYKKFGNKACATMLIDKTPLIIDRIFTKL